MTDITNTAPQVVLSDLNSVLLEGIITKTFPPLEDAGGITQVELRSNRKPRDCQAKAQASFVRVDVQNIVANRAMELSIGRMVRIVGRIHAPYRKPLRVVAEHLELKPLPAVRAES